MKQYLLFTGDEHYPSGGWNDVVGDYDTIEEAKKQIRSCDLWHIVDSKTGQIVESRSSDDE